MDMSFVEAIRSGIQNYANFNGRAIRSEYWYWTLFAILVSLPLNLMGQGSVMVGGLSFIVGLALFLPGLAVSVRRLHDVGKSGWNLLWSFLPFGVLYVLYLVIKRGDEGGNRYGAPYSGSLLLAQ
jgi:uncharacterized membrane protein YhaH (DUF805 family)